MLTPTSALPAGTKHSNPLAGAAVPPNEGSGTSSPAPLDVKSAAVVPVEEEKSGGDGAPQRAPQPPPASPCPPDGICLVFLAEEYEAGDDNDSTGDHLDEPSSSCIARQPGADARHDGQRGEPAADKQSKQIGRAQPGPGASGSPKYCIGSTAIALALLWVAFFIEAILFAFHCTPIMDVLADEPDVASWVGVTLPVKVGAGLLLAPAMLLTLLGVVNMTCLRRRTLRRALATDETRDVLQAKSLVMTIFNYVFFTTSPASEHFFVVIFLLEVKEAIVQGLAVDQMARAGIGQVALSLYVSLILLNSIATVAMTWIIRRINRVDGDPVRQRAEASFWVAWLLLFDATTDLLYSSFGLAHLLFRYFRDFGGDSFGEVAFVERFADATQRVGDATDFKSFMILSEAEAALFGGSSATDIGIKFFSRVLPLLQAPLRVILAFTIRQNLSAGVDQGAALGESGRLNAAATTPNIITSSTKKNDAEDEAPQDQRPRQGGGAIISSARRWMAASVRRSAFRRRYRTVPRWAIGLQLVAVVAFSLAAYARLWSWGECPISEIRQSCAVRAFPIFQGYDHSEDDDDWQCRSCACNTLLYISANCSALAVRNRSMQDGVPGQPSGCQGYDRSSGPPRYASQVLGLSRRILRPAASIFVQACPSDVHLLETLAANADQLSVLQIYVASETATRIQSDGAANASITPVWNNSSNMSVTWTFPPSFGYRPGSDGAASDVWPLASLRLIRDQRWVRTGAQQVAVRLANWPSSLWQMTATLRALEFSGLGLTNQQVPLSLRSLTGLQELHLGYNKLSFIPLAVAQLTSLRWLFINRNLISLVPDFIGNLVHMNSLTATDNLISSLPSSLGRFTSLQGLRLDNNSLTMIPPFIGQLTSLTGLSLDNNSLTTIPASIGRLTSLKNLYLGSNSLTTIPPSFGDLTNLKRLTLEYNTLTTIPASILTAPRSSFFYLRLEANNISFASMTAVLAVVISTSSSSSATVTTPSSLALLGRNPACSTGNLVSRVGPWRIKCKPECAHALGAMCRETGIGELKSSVGDGICDPECNTAACRWDDGDCQN